MAHKNAIPQTVLVLGATSAIAQAWMRLLAPHGTQFFLVARQEERLRAVAADLQTRGATAVHIEALNLDRTDEHPAMLERAARVLGRIDCAMIAHGVLGDQSQADRDFSHAAMLLHTNLISVVSLGTWLANYFEAQGQGTLAAISSVAGDRGRWKNCVYGASKAGMNMFLDGLRNRLDRRGVQVLTIRPGFVATPMTAHMPQGPLFAQPERVARDIQRAIEKRRDIVYTPWFWRWMMLAVRLIPEWKFKRMDV
jgi:short-subunit dehydrogenase